MKAKVENMGAWTPWGKAQSSWHRYAISKIDVWDRQTKLIFLKAYESSDWATVNNLTSDITGSVLTRNLKIGTLVDIIREQEAIK